MDIPKTGRRDGTLPIEDEVRKILRAAMKNTGKTRKQIARDMGEVLGRSVTSSMLADFTRNGTKKRQVRFPLAWTPALVKATGSRELGEFALSPERRENLKLGDWVIGSSWVIKKLKVRAGRSATQILRKARSARK